jgi:hypothetical protein
MWLRGGAFSTVGLLLTLLIWCLPDWPAHRIRIWSDIVAPSRWERINEDFGWSFQSSALPNVSLTTGLTGLLRRRDTALIYAASASVDPDAE